MIQTYLKSWCILERDYGGDSTVVTWAESKVENWWGASEGRLQQRKYAAKGARKLDMPVDGEVFTPYQRLFSVGGLIQGLGNELPFDLSLEYEPVMAVRLCWKAVGCK